MQKKKRTNEEWEKLIAEQQTSGKEAKVWCVDNNINYYTYMDRKCRLNKLKANSTKAKKPALASPKFKQVEIDDEGSKTEQTSEPATPGVNEIAVKVGKFTIIVQRDFDEKTFLKTCEVVAKLC